jgi:hypothetical protein
MILLSVYNISINNIVYISGDGMKYTSHKIVTALLPMLFGVSLLFSQAGISGQFYLQNPKKVVKLKTTVTPRKSNVVFVGKAMEVIITPFDEFGNEIKELQTGLNIYLSINDAIQEHSQTGQRIIYGKTYLYLTPLKIHNKPNEDELKVGAFLTDSVTGLPNPLTGDFFNVLVTDHIPSPPNINTLEIINEQTNTKITNSVIRPCRTKDKYLFIWGIASDSNDKPLKKSFALDSNDTRYWIQDQCKIKYKFKVTEYPDYKFKNESDTNNFLSISAGELMDIYNFIRIGATRAVFVNYYVVCEDEIYKYDISEYSDKLITTKKKIEIVNECGEGVDDQNQIPFDFYLAQNYPNPFNPNTTIVYGIPKAGNVNLSIYNIFGQKLRTLINAKQSAGYKNISWDGRNEKGIPVSSGTYIYMITSGDFVQLKKMHLIK